MSKVMRHNDWTGKTEKWRKVERSQWQISNFWMFFFCVDLRPSKGSWFRQIGQIDQCDFHSSESIEEKPIILMGNIESKHDAYCIYIYGSAQTNSTEKSETISPKGQVCSALPISCELSNQIDSHILRIFPSQLKFDSFRSSSVYVWSTFNVQLSMASTH